MLKRRNNPSKYETLASGPGSLTQALGITKLHNGLSLSGPRIWIEDRGFDVSEGNIIAGPRVGIDYAGEDALLPWRFRVIT